MSKRWLFAAVLVLGGCNKTAHLGSPSGPHGEIRFVTAGTVKSVDLATGKVTDLHPGRDPAFSPATREDVWVLDDKKLCGKDADDRCVMVAGTDGKPSVAMRGCQGCELASLSPDGKLWAYAAYCRERTCGSSSHGTFVRDRAGKLVHAFPSLGSPTWMPDGKLLLAGDSLQGRVGLFVAGDLEHESRIDTDLADPKEVSVSPDGKRVAFKMSGSDGQVYVLALDGKTPAKKITDLPEHTAAWPTFSPDGKWIAFEDKEQSWKDGVLSIVSVDGGTPTQVLDAGKKAVSAGGRLLWR